MLQKSDGHWGKEETNMKTGAMKGDLAALEVHPKCFAPDSTQKVLPSEHHAGLGTPCFAVSSLHTVKCHPERSVARSL